MIDADPVATAVRAVMATRTAWTGTASDLLGALAEVMGERVAKSKTWPDSPRALAGRLRRAATFLRKVGIEIGFGREGRARTRTIYITTPSLLPCQKTPGAQPSAPSASSAPTPKTNPANGFAAQPLRTVANDADGSGQSNAPTVRANPLKINTGTAADGADAKPPPNLHRKKRAAGGGVYERGYRPEGCSCRRCRARNRRRRPRARGISKPPAAVLGALSKHKAEIVALLRPVGTAGRPRTGELASTNARAFWSMTADCCALRPKERHSKAA